MKSNQSNSKQAECKHCGEPIWTWQMVEKEIVQVPYVLEHGAISVTCGKCVANGVLRAESFEARRKQLVELLKEPINNLKHFRKKMGVNQEELASILGVDRSMISKVEKGLKPMPESWKEKIKGHITLSTIA